jgi:hypothetical protein
MKNKIQDRRCSPRSQWKKENKIFLSKNIKNTQSEKSIKNQKGLAFLGRFRKGVHFFGVLL